MSLKISVKYWFGNPSDEKFKKLSALMSPRNGGLDRQTSSTQRREPFDSPNRKTILPSLPRPDQAFEAFIGLMAARM
jgi:hypothetical protein